MEILRKHSELLGGGTDFPVQVVKNWIQNEIIVDSAIILSDMMISQNYGGIDSSNEIMRKYINSTNKNLKVFSVDLVGYGERMYLEEQFAENNFIRIFGMSDSIL